MHDRLLLRIHQTVRHVHPRPLDNLEQELVASQLTQRQLAAFQTLPVFDQRHSFCVFASLRAGGQDNCDLLSAALLHDIGKREPGVRVGLFDRVAKVLLSRWAPGLLAKLIQPSNRGWNSGLVLAVHHPAFGAALARQFGCSEVTSELIARHEDTNVCGNVLLKALREADSVC